MDKLTDRELEILTLRIHLNHEDIGRKFNRSGGWARNQESRIRFKLIYLGQKSKLNENNHQDL